MATQEKLFGGVKINELKVSTNKGYCNKFQIGKCTFGEKCRYRHEIDVVDLYSDLAIFVVTGNVGGLKGYIGIGTTKNVKK